MSLCSFKTSLKPKEAYELIKQEMEYELLHDESHILDNGLHSYVLVFERYYFRTSNRGALTVTINNFNEKTEINSIAAGTSQGAFFNFDWGAGDDFAYGVKEIFMDYLIE